MSYMEMIRMSVPKYNSSSLHEIPAAGQSAPDLDPLTNIAENEDSFLDMDERRREILSEFDNARFSAFHLKVILVAGVGFFADAYDIFAISIASTMLGYVYGNNGNGLEYKQDFGIKVATPLGTFIGQIFFGWLADRIGRKRMYGVELVIIVAATFMQALAGHSPSVSIIGALIVWRFLLGLGIGGDYPLSAVISSEFATTHTRGRMMTAVFSAQGWGQSAAAIIGLILVESYRKAAESSKDATMYHGLDQMWRLLIGLGAVPGVFALYFRLTIPETPRFRIDVERNVYQASEDVVEVFNQSRFSLNPQYTIHRIKTPKASWVDFKQHFSQWANLKVLLGTCYSWFALDIVYYGLGLNSSIILKIFKFQNSSTLDPDKIQTLSSNAHWETLYYVCLGNVILDLAGLIPGFYATMLLIDSWGRKPIQFLGFVMLTIILTILAAGYEKFYDSGGVGLVVFYCLANFFENFGPNSTTFIIPGEAFPTRYRSTAHGLSAASGKLGAIISQIIFSQILKEGNSDGSLKSTEINKLRKVFAVFAAFTFTGIFSTFLVPETKGLTLEEISNEKQEGFVSGIDLPSRSRGKSGRISS